MSTDAILARLMTLHPRAIDLELGRIQRLLDTLGNPERRLPPVVHIAGTNGKGSLVAYTRAMAEAAGLRVHTYTSPHLVHFNERIRLAGTLIDNAELEAVLEECEQANDGQLITYFEITTAAAFLAFARHPADLLVLEVGLGGRYDTTNVVNNPVVTAVTPIGIDHTQFLGPTLRQIAREKSGILKHGVPAVIGRQRPEPAAVLVEDAQALDVPLFRMGHEWRMETRDSGFRYESDSLALDLPAPRLVGAHQIDNAATAVAVVERLRAAGLRIGDDAVRKGLATVEWPARLQPLVRGPLVDALPAGCELWLDGGHNEDCGLVLAEQSRAWAREPGALPLYLIFGMLTTKDAGGFLRPLARHATSAWAVPIPDHASYTPEEACRQADDVGLTCLPAPSVPDAVEDLLANVHPPFRVLICGSLYLAGTVLAKNG
ncbi:folylpolyglutamate synthase/dihydrofolate synthase family protein [Reyranella sp. CPCC 100927]|uniref:bifunctional folylpolyglutamate synthase/dihydrofolate synthase n=1 Tax=Reyranella sp. CPCC 100927 TaxID=2599616 RepID=UPI0011B39C95|nr:folylpolyglutamate synthase/dihydrofolate synthase family protein [Reyranella sp. CPCC 100927]TWT15020.1 bifunctional folylpolyglutamate synthase/dihydrofolate synthase [Reyranella sp. CPCC 100927]